MKERDPNEPVVMLNMLKYRSIAQSGFGIDELSREQAYGEYSKKFAKLQPSFGGEPLWMGQALDSIIGRESWDVVILVCYPSRRQFTEMIDDPDHQAISPIRGAALADSRLIEMNRLLPRAL